MSRETSAKKNGQPAKRRLKRPKQSAELPEKTRKLILKAFRLTYEAHHPKSS